MEKDDGFNENSRRIRLESLARYCKRAKKLIKTEAFKTNKPKIQRAPDISLLTSDSSGLKEVINRRWLDAQKCQHFKCYLSAIILMGSILEALLLARAFKDSEKSHRATAAPKEKNGKNRALPDWTLSNLIDVAVELGWLKTDRGKFSHALRDSRNMVHPYFEVSSKANFDIETCKTCWKN